MMTFEELKGASSSYYAGAGTVDDATFDAAFAYWRKMRPDDAFFREVGFARGDTGTKARLSMHMGSLSNVFTREEATAWLARLPENEKLRLSWKVDGCSVELTFHGGVLVAAITRGNGVVGTLITDNARRWSGVPSRIGYLGTLHVRGEAYIPRSVFSGLKGFANARNAVAGIVGRRKPEGNENVHFMAFSAIIPGGNTWQSLEEALQGVRSLSDGSLAIVPGFVVTAGKVDTLCGLYDSYIAHRANVDFEADGVVLHADNFATVAAMGYSNGGTCPCAAVAWKFPAVPQRTWIKALRWQVGMTGAITPVADLEPVVIGGATITSATLSNAARVKELGAGAGVECLVRRAGEVIPEITAVCDPVADVALPTECPSCGSAVRWEGRALFCTGKTCAAKRHKRLMNWVKKVDILNLGPETVTALVEAGMVNGIADIYRMDAAKLAALIVGGSPIGAGARSICDNIDLHRQMPAEIFIGALGINGFGRTMAAKLSKPVGWYISATLEDLLAIDGVGEEKAAAVVDFFAENAEEVADLRSALVIHDPPEAPATGTWKVCFTGWRLTHEEEAKFEAAGGREASSVSVKAGNETLCLAASDVRGMSNKLKNARAKGVPILSVEEFVGCLAQDDPKKAVLDVIRSHS